LTTVGANAPPTLSRAFYAASVAEFLADTADAILGRLSARHVAQFASAEREQVHAWLREIAILRRAFLEIGPGCETWSILLEVPLLRLGKRLDAVVLASGRVMVVEFKIGANRYNAADRVQVERYALALRDFHEVSRSRVIVPILCAEDAPARPLTPAVLDGVAGTLEANPHTLAQALLAVKAETHGVAEPETWFEFDNSPYRPTPTIVEAAQALYAGHQIADIGRGDAADAELQSAADALDGIVAEAQTRAGKTVCFVTGAPGAGKTLLGLNLALKGRAGETSSALLSGNPPLVHVLTEALAEDAAKRGKLSKAEARHQAAGAIQNLLGYLKEHRDGALPPEHVVVFDEAQRAWDAEVGQKLMGRAESEPAAFLNILDRLDWACLVCLVGPGQEINRGEGGLALWGEALFEAARSGRSWTIIAAPQAVRGGADVAGAGLISTLAQTLDIREERRIHLANSIRAYRNALHGKWVAALLESDLAATRRIADEMTGPPALVARDLETAKAWLRERRRGGRSVGLLVSSGGVRLVAEGVPPAPRSNELDAICHWFLKPYTDFRSSGALEIPMSEFGCQGLEIDYAGLCWGGDLVWHADQWRPRLMRAPKWQVQNDPDKRRFRLNGYRVLLTRARAGLVIYVPAGDTDDPTRSPEEFDAIAATLVAAGCEELW
jgi:hypothetical protein